MYVGTIHVTHLSIVLKMFEMKKPVLCEKPLTMNAQDTAILIEAAKRNNVFLMEVRNIIKTIECSIICLRSYYAFSLCRSCSTV